MLIPVIIFYIWQIELLSGTFKISAEVAVDLKCKEKICEVNCDHNNFGIHVRG